jgi:hypothetical protein
MANCHSERSEESIGDSSPIGLRMTRWGVAKQSLRKNLLELLNSGMLLNRTIAQPIRAQAARIWE